MPYLLGTDEAAYGPNLGPLVVSTTVWHVPDDALGNDLYARLGKGIVRRAAEAGPSRVAIADSKVLYTSGTGLGHLERALLAALGILQRKVDDWDAIWTAVAPGRDVIPRDEPWYADYAAPLPIDATPDEIDSARAILADALDGAGARLVDVRSRVVFPREFNRLVAEHGSKGTLLSHCTLGLAAEVLRPLGDEPIHVLCDKHGGRDRYAGLLAEHFPDWVIETRAEGRPWSSYQFGPPERRVEFGFQAKGESHLAAALASMASKYLRELAMRPLNEFWARRVKCLRPTAGYPVDAARFMADIAPVRTELGIEEDMLWRVK
ncbi:MAG: hypothetical protein NTW96_14265 [Planctomycetia bacterium]|nr:hypothetical protein [Planctomycetia bacterium]